MDRTFSVWKPPYLMANILCLRRQAEIKIIHDEDNFENGSAFYAKVHSFLMFINLSRIKLWENVTNWYLHWHMGISWGNLNYTNHQRTKYRYIQSTVKSPEGYNLCNDRIILILDQICLIFLAVNTAMISLHRIPRNRYAISMI